MKNLSKEELTLWNQLQLKADMFDYLCWLEHVTSPEELTNANQLVITSDNTACFAKTYADAVRVAMEHDKEIFDETREIMDGENG